MQYYIWIITRTCRRRGNQWRVRPSSMARRRCHRRDNPFGDVYDGHGRRYPRVAFLLETSWWREGSWSSRPWHGAWSGRGSDAPWRHASGSWRRCPCGLVSGGRWAPTCCRGRGGRWAAALPPPLWKAVCWSEGPAGWTTWAGSSCLDNTKLETNLINEWRSYLKLMTI